MPRGPTPIAPEVRFTRYCQPVASGCIEWTGGLSADGYGSFSYQGRAHNAHRAAWMMANGHLPGPHVVVCHRCDNPKCVNLEHLFLGSQADNIADMNTKGRQFAHRGERAPKAKLTATQVVEMRRLKRDGASYGAIARRFGVARPSVAALCQGKSWKHIPL